MNIDTDPIKPKLFLLFKFIFIFIKIHVHVYILTSQIWFSFIYWDKNAIFGHYGNMPKFDGHDIMTTSWPMCPVVRVWPYKINFVSCNIGVCVETYYSMASHQVKQTNDYMSQTY